jgi:electron transfer flavoprotein alpha subunit
VEGKEVAARLAVKTGSGIITDAVGGTADLTAEQPIFGGSVVVSSKVAAGTPVITVRANSTAPSEAAGAGTVEQVTATFSAAADAPLPSTTADGSPSERASVSSS